MTRTALLLASLTLCGPAWAETLSGHASLPAGQPAPGGARFQAVLEDISRADAPAVELGAVSFTAPQAYGWPFVIEYDETALKPGHRYSVRGRVTGAAGQLLYVTDTVVPVLGEGDPGEARLSLVAVPGAEQPVTGAHGLRLPATFTGTLPCADCAGISHHLDLWPDQSYHMRRVWEGKDRPFTRDEVGQWYVDPAREALILHGAAEMPLQWQITGPGSLRALDMDGAPITSDLPYELNSTGALEETDLSLPLQGLFTYMADAALFEVCLTGKRYPVVTEGDYLALERAYGAARTEPGAPVMATLIGTLDTRPAMEGPDRRRLVVERFVSTGSETRCERHRAPAALENTYWRVVSLDGAEVTAQPGAREPHLLLRGGDPATYQATVGCNGLGGSYAREGENGLSFSRGISTLMACPDPLGDLERRFADVLAAATRWEIAGQSLMILDRTGAVRAVFEAVYLP